MVLANSPAGTFSLGVGGAQTVDACELRLDAHLRSTSDCGQCNSTVALCCIIELPDGVVSSTTEPELVAVMYEATARSSADTR